MECREYAGIREGAPSQSGGYGRSVNWISWSRRSREGCPEYCVSSRRSRSVRHAHLSRLGFVRSCSLGSVAVEWYDTGRTVLGESVSLRRLRYVCPLYSISWRIRGRGGCKAHYFLQLKS